MASGKGNRKQDYTEMVPPRRIRPLTSVELGHLSVERLLKYRRQALALENTLAASDYTDIVDPLDNTFIWFKEDLRWKPLYDAILAELARKQKSDNFE